MLLECIGNTPEHLSSERDKRAYKKNVHLEEVALKIGNIYIAYGVVFRDGEDLPWFLVCPYDDDEYPTPEHGSFFKLIDNEISPGWKFIADDDKVSLLPKRWADDPYAMEKLFDGDPEEESYFRQLKSSMEDRYKSRLS